jgi:uncharacterized surface protein with fasciclin (FAS1) repeats
MPIIRSLALAASAAFGLASAAQAQSIVEIAAGDERFSTLVTAVQTAGLADTLAGPGPFTVFAPTDAAFAALPDGQVEALLQPQNREALTQILLYHVDDRRLTASMIPAGSNYFRPVLDSARLCITKGGGGVSIADSTDQSANVVVADIAADNGVIHVVDKVLIPGVRPDCH